MRLLWIVLLVLLLIGLGSGIYMSLETMSPGLEGSIEIKRETYSFANQIHATVMGFSLPVATVGGLTAFLLAERPVRRWAKIALHACGYTILGLSVSALVLSPSLWDLLSRIENTSIMFACAVLLSLLLLRHPNRNASAFIFFGACAAPALIYFTALQLLQQNAATTLLEDTLVATAVIHITGVALLLTCFSALSVWAHSRGARMSGWGTAIYVGVLLVTVRFYLAEHFAAGANGMPRRYADYPQTFAEQMAAASWWSFLYVGLIGFGIARLAYAVRTRDRTTVADVF